MSNYKQISKKPWDALFKLDKISSEERDVMNDFGKLQIGERMQEFKKVIIIFYVFNLFQYFVFF